MEAVPFVGDLAVDHVDQPATELLDFQLRRHVGTDHHELVAAEPGNHVLVAGRGAQPFGDGVEHRIAGGMAVLVVDRLEAVEVEHQYRYRRLASLFRQQAFEELEQLVAVRQAGQGIVQGQMLDLRMGFDLVGDVGRRAAIAAGDAVADRAGAQLADPRLALAVAESADQAGRRTGIGQPFQPLDDVHRIAIQQLVQPPPDPGLRLVAGDVAEAHGEIGEDEMPVDFPDPVRGRLGYRLETFLAGQQGLVAAFQDLLLAIHRAGVEHGAAAQPEQQPGGEHEDSQQRQRGLPQHGATRTRRHPGQAMGSALQGKAFLVARRAAGQQVQVGDAVVAAELGQLHRGQPVDEDHHRGLGQVDGRMIAGGLDRRGDQYRRCAVEVDVAADRRFVHRGTACGAEDVPGVGVQRVGQRAFGKLALEHGVASATVVDDEDAVVAIGGVEHRAEVVLGEGPVHVDPVSQIDVGVGPEGIGGGELLGIFPAILQRLFHVEMALLDGDVVLVPGDVQDRPAACTEGEEKGGQEH